MGLDLSGRGEHPGRNLTQRTGGPELVGRQGWSKAGLFGIVREDCRVVSPPQPAPENLDTHYHDVKLQFCRDHWGTNFEEKALKMLNAHEILAMIVKTGGDGTDHLPMFNDHYKIEFVLRSTYSTAERGRKRTPTLLIIAPKHTDCDEATMRTWMNVVESLKSYIDDTVMTYVCKECRSPESQADFLQVDISDCDFGDLDIAVEIIRKDLTPKLDDENFFFDYDVPDNPNLERRIAPGWR